MLAALRSLLAIVPVAALLAGSLAPAARAHEPVPDLEGPIGSPGSAFVQGTAFDLAEVGYVSEEYFVSGTASAYTNVGALEPDGRWTVTPGATAAYKTRIVVHRPVKARRFDGTVVVEWLNVSAGADAAPEWIAAHTHFTREGWIWVGVSAQLAGVEGGGGLLGVIDAGLKTVNPQRYGSLLHPGDSFSYDIFSQAGRLVRSAEGPLAGHRVKRVIAAGESQSAFRMVTYVNAIHPLERVYDGYFIHSRGGIGAALSEAPEPAIGVPGTAAVRDDLDVPVLTYETESDLIFLAYVGARQPDAANFRLWEVAGTAHADTYTVLVGRLDRGGDPEVMDVVIEAHPLPGVIDCTLPLNSGPQHVTVKAAFAALERWVRTGKAPRSAPLLDVSPGPPVAIATDEHGNALGGVRTPWVDAPIATFTGDQGPAASILCRLFGTTMRFDGAKLASLYPTHKAFVAAYKKALKRSVRGGWVLKPEARLMKRWALASSVGAPAGS